MATAENKNDAWKRFLARFGIALMAFAGIAKIIEGDAVLGLLIIGFALVLFSYLETIKK